MSNDSAPQSAGISRISVIIVLISVVVFLALFVPAIQQAREAARRTQSRNNLKQIGLALHNYHDNFSIFPPGGVFNADGKAFHEWTTSIAPFYDASPWFNQIDFNIPWDHPEQVDLFRDFLTHQSYHWTNPSVSPGFRPDGLVNNHYAGSQSVFYRNSAVSMTDWNGNTERLLVADAFDQFIPAGCPYGWRDAKLGLNTNLDGFGCRPRESTQCLMGDGSVRTLGPTTDDRILTMMAGPIEQQPVESQVAKPSSIPLIDVTRIWKVEWIFNDRGENGCREYEVRWTQPNGKPGKSHYLRP